jgi:hypothetical protein
VLNLGVRTPPKIKPNEFHLPLLDDSDFDIAAYGAEVTSMLDGCELIRDTALQSRLARLCIEKTKLCLLLGRVFDTLYTDAHPKLGNTTEITLILMPDAQGANTDDISRLGLELQHWLHNLPSDVPQQQSLKPALGASQEIVLLHRSLVMMFYHAIMCAFYRPQILAVVSPVVGRDLTKQAMSYAALMITRHLEDIQLCGLLRFLPSASVTFLLTAAVNHLVDYKTSFTEECKQRHLHRFRDCRCYLRPIQSVHIYAKYAGIFLDNAAHQAGITAESSSTPPIPARCRSGDEEGLGTWAVAHTPDQLLDQPRQDLHPRNLGDGPASIGLLSAMTEVPGHPSQAAMDVYSNGANIGFDPQNYLASLEYAEVECILTSTIMEHGWIDEIAERWPDYPCSRPWLGSL